MTPEMVILQTIRNAVLSLKAESIALKSAARDDESTIIAHCLGRQYACSRMLRAIDNQMDMIEREDSK